MPPCTVLFWAVPHYSLVRYRGVGVRIYQLDLRNFRGFATLSIIPAGHVLLVGEPGAGRSDIIAALDRALSPDSTRGRLPNELDFNRRDTGRPAEVEVVLGILGEALEQTFFDHLEVWDIKTRQLVAELAESENIDRDQYDLVVRICYRATWDPNEEQGQHIVYYPKGADADAGQFERLGRAEREALPFVSLETRSRPLDIGTRGEFRRLVEGAVGGDFSKALEALETEVGTLAGQFSATAQMSDALEAVLKPLRRLLGVGDVSASNIIRFLPEGGSLSGLLRSLAPAVDLQDGLAAVPLYRHGSTLTATLAVAQALARAGDAGVVAIDDLGEGLDSATAQHLGATLRRTASQAWVSTRRPDAAQAFRPDELVRLARDGAGLRKAFYGRAPKTRPELIAARHWHLQLLPAMASRAVGVLEGPHDTASLTAVAKRRLEQDGVPLPAASRVTLIDAAAADGSGGSSAIPRLAAAARALGLRTVAVLDYDGDDAQAKAEIDQNVKSADVVVRLPKDCAIEMSLVSGLPEDVIREALRAVAAAFGPKLPADLDKLAGVKLLRAARETIKQGPGYHAQFVEALPPGVHPPLACSILDAIVAAAVGNDEGLVQLP